MVEENRVMPGLVYGEAAECEFPAKLEIVPEVARRLHVYCLRHGMDEQIWWRVELALVEGLNNAIVHGARGVREPRIRASWRWTGEMLEIEIVDPGDFLPLPGLAQLPAPLAGSGRGLYLIYTLVESVRHQLLQGRHSLTLRTRVGPVIESPHDSAATLEAMTAELGNSFECITALFRFGEDLAVTRSFEDFVGHVLQRLLKLVTADEAWLRLGESGTALALVDLPRATHQTPMPKLLGPDAEAIEMQVFQQGDAQTVEDCSHLQPSDPLRRERGSAAVRPILFRDATLGVLSVVRAEPLPYFNGGEIGLISTVAALLGIARTLADSQEQQQVQLRTERELEIAAEVQQSLLPRNFPDTGPFRVFGLSQAAHDVGGDYFDVLAMGDRGLLLAIADVMGKGMPAALLATILRTAIRAHSELAEDPGRLLTVVNRQLGADLHDLDMFITTRIAFFPQTTREMIFANAGHCPLLKLSQGSASLCPSRGNGVPLGIREDSLYESVRVPLAPGDRCIFLTDGLYEAESASGQILGFEALTQELPALCAGNPRESCLRLLDYVTRYSAGAPACDDRTLLIIQRL